MDETIDDLLIVCQKNTMNFNTMRHITKLRWGIIGMLGILLLCSMGIAAETVADSSLKPRIVVLTDIAPTDIEPDDMESMIRLLSHADLYDLKSATALIR